MAKERTKNNMPILRNKSFPVHGVIGDSEPGWCDLRGLHRRPNIEVGSRNARRRKLDLEDTANTCNSSLCSRTGHELPEFETRIPDWNEGKRTSEIYPCGDNPTSKIPDRFDNPDWFKGYGIERKQHPFYRTTSSQYGQHPPNVHTMPTQYLPMKNLFSEHLTATGMGRNRSLNMK